MGDTLRTTVLELWERRAAHWRIHYEHAAVNLEVSSSFAKAAYRKAELAERNYVDAFRLTQHPIVRIQQPSPPCDSGDAGHYPVLSWLVVEEICQRARTLAGPTSSPCTTSFDDEPCISQEGMFLAAVDHVVHQRCIEAEEAARYAAYEVAHSRMAEQKATALFSVACRGSELAQDTKTTITEKWGNNSGVSCVSRLLDDTERQHEELVRQFSAELLSPTLQAVTEHVPLSHAATFMQPLEPNPDQRPRCPACIGLSPDAVAPWGEARDLPADINDIDELDDSLGAVIAREDDEDSTRFYFSIMPDSIPAGDEEVRAEIEVLPLPCRPSTAPSSPTEWSGIRVTEGDDIGSMSDNESRPMLARKSRWRSKPNIEPPTIPTTRRGPNGQRRVRVRGRRTSKRAGRVLEVV
ncbi:hypothetical protein BKA62DRAFT_704698 [Auriculariales sp. MPI-PUGE-AT-0066]|nr:hypothetical protein BKA62DRAFT_704698 [Auriculariales sp. MPI-PUGE-AT-0066]